MIFFFFRKKEDPNKINKLKEIRVNEKEDELNFQVTETRAIKEAHSLKILI